MAATVAVGSGPRVYVANGVGGTVSVIDAGAHAVVGAVTVEGNLRGIALNATGTRAYVANYSDHNISVIDIASNTVMGAKKAI